MFEQLLDHTLQAAPSSRVHREAGVDNPPARAGFASSAAQDVVLEIAAASRLFFVMLQVRVAASDSATPEMPPLRSGECHWQATSACGRVVTLAFDWTELRSGVLCLADPMQIRSNLHLSRDGVAVDEAERQLLLANCIYRLNWQPFVLGHLGLQPPAPS